MKKEIKTPTMSGKGYIYLSKNMSYKGVKKNGEPVGLYKI